MSEIELLNFELQEKILNALIGLAQQGRGAAQQRGIAGIGIAAGLSAMLSSDE
jgi:hypothetical protein